MSPAPKLPFRKLKEGENVHQAWLRREFLKAVDELAPDATLQLFRLAGPAYRKLALTTGESQYRVVLEVDDPEATKGISGDEPGDDDASSSASPKSLEAIDALRSETSRLVTEWARTYNFHHDYWLLNHAWLVLQIMFFQPVPRDSRKLRRLASYARYWNEFSGEMLWAFPVLDLGHPPPVGSLTRSATEGSSSEGDGEVASCMQGLHDTRIRAAAEAADWGVPPLWPYQPAFETKKEFLERAKRYADWIEDGYRKAGWEAPPYLTEDWQNHIRWLARFQVPRQDFANGEPISEIARCHTAPGVKAPRAMSERNVREQCRKMARLIGLTRRSEPRDP